jgi:hypothetical protein
MTNLMRFLMAVTVFISTGALAQSPASSGLGQSWPNAPDLSSSPRYHVFVFVRDGVRFIQVNDSAGRGRGAVAAAGGQMLALPIGTAAQMVIQDTAAANAPTAAPAATAEPVYQDEQTTITAQPQRDGTLRLQATNSCKDPITCNTQVISGPQ